MSARAFLLRNLFGINDFSNGAPIGKPYMNIKYVQTYYDNGLAIRQEALKIFSGTPGKIQDTISNSKVSIIYLRIL